MCRWCVVTFRAKFKQFAELNSQAGFHKPYPCRPSGSRMVDSPGVWQHADLLWLKWNGEPWTSTTIAEHVLVWSFDYLGEDDREVIASDIVPFTTTRREIRKLSLISPGIIQPQPREEELQEVLF